MSDDITVAEQTNNECDRRVTGTYIPGEKKRALDVALRGGSAAAGGQNGPGKILKISINDTTPVDITQEFINAGFSNFNCINFQNRSNKDIEFNFESTWTYGDGWLIQTNKESFLDVTHVSSVYLLSESGTKLIHCMAISNTAVDTP